MEIFEITTFNFLSKCTESHTHRTKQQNKQTRTKKQVISYREVPADSIPIFCHPLRLLKAAHDEVLTPSCSEAQESPEPGDTGISQPPYQGAQDQEEDRGWGGSYHSRWSSCAALFFIPCKRQRKRRESKQEQEGADKQTARLA